MSATLAPTIWDLAKDKFNSIAKRRRVPEDPKWKDAKLTAVVSVVGAALRTSMTLPVFLGQPDAVSTLSATLSFKAIVDATVNCVKTFRAARQSALRIADPLEPQPTLTPEESESRSMLALAFAAAAGVPNRLNSGEFGWAFLNAGLTVVAYAYSRKGPRGPGE